MFNIWTTLSTLKAIRAADWDKDQDELERERLDDYALCFDELEKSIKAMDESIHSILKQSGRYDLEQAVTLGKLQLPAYIFMQIARAQQGPVSKYQHKMIDRYLDAQSSPKDAGIDRYEYRSGLTADSGGNGAWDALYASTGLTESHCGTFWDTFIEILYETDDADAEFACIAKSYGEICWRFALLGDCGSGSEKAEAVFQIFAKGLQKQLEDDVSVKRPSGEEKLTADMTACLEKMKEICNRIAEKGGREDTLIQDTLPYFILSMIIGLLESTAAGEAEKRAAFQYFLSSVGVQFKIAEEPVYAEGEARPGIKQVFDERMGGWNETDFWKAYEAAADRAGSPELVEEFTELVQAFLQAAEYLLHYKFPGLDLSGKAQAYMEETLETIGRGPSAEREDAASGEEEEGETVPDTEAEEAAPAGQKKGNAYGAVFARNIEQYGTSAKADQEKKAKGPIAAGIIAAAVLCGVLIFLLFR